MRIFNKEVIASYTMYIDDNEFACYVLEDGNYYNIHILDNIFKQDEMNTLKLQELKEYVSLDTFDNIYMMTQILKHYLWYKTYGFSISIADKTELEE